MTAVQETPEVIAARLQAQLPADVLLLGEQHDAPAHHRIEQAAVQILAAQGRLAALAIEMAEQEHSTAALPQGADEAQVRAALGWNEKAWPWRDYAPAVMAAVRMSVPVLGANLPRERMKDAMADVSLDAQLDPEALEAQRRAVREGHCGMLPESQIGPMTRIQIARDRAMARTLAQAHRPGRTVLLIAGAGHVDRRLGVPRHLPSELVVKAVWLRARPDGSDPAEAGDARHFDAVWDTPAPPPRDYCATLRRPSPPANPAAPQSTPSLDSDASNEN